MSLPATQRGIPTPGVEEKLWWGSTGAGDNASLTMKMPIFTPLRRRVTSGELFSGATFSPFVKEKQVRTAHRQSVSHNRGMPNTTPAPSTWGTPTKNPMSLRHISRAYRFRRTYVRVIRSGVRLVRRAAANASTACARAVARYTGRRPYVFASGTASSG